MVSLSHHFAFSCKTLLFPINILQIVAKCSPRSPAWLASASRPPGSWSCSLPAHSGVGPPVAWDKNLLWLNWLRCEVLPGVGRGNSKKKGKGKLLAVLRGGGKSQWAFTPSFASSAAAAAGDLTGHWTMDSGQATWLFLCSWDLHANSVSQIPQFKHDSNSWDKIKSMVGGVQTSLSSWLLLSRFTDPSQTAEHEARPILRAESITAHCLCSHFFKSIAPSCKLACTLDICMCAMCIA